MSVTRMVLISDEYPDDGNKIGDVTIGKTYDVDLSVYTGRALFLDDAGDLRSVRHSIFAPVQKPDAVSHPSHYNQGGIECIDAIRASMSLEAFRGFLKGNQLKYLWRYEAKGKAAEDIAKSNQYGAWLAETYTETK